MYMYIHVHVVMYLYVHGIYMSVPCSDTYVLFCPILSRWVGFQMGSLLAWLVAYNHTSEPWLSSTILPGSAAMRITE